MDKRNQNGMGGLFVADNDTESTFDREEWKRQKAAEREGSRKRKANSLSEADRDFYARRILRQLGLSSRHRADLHRRGLTDDQIEEIGFKSVEAGQKLIVPINPDFPGVNIDGDRFKNASGYLVPLFNEYSQIIGFQIAADDRTRAKYPWLSQDSDFRLPSGEPPLTIRFVPGNREVRLVEGTLKPLIASHRLNKTFIGASGGHFASSPQQLKRYLEDIQPDRVIISGDAGWKLNPHVRRSYEATAQLLTEWGYKVYFEDWGQSENKNTPDIDEISPDEKRVLRKWKSLEDNKIDRAARSQWLESKKFTSTVTQDQQYVDFEMPP